MLRYSRNPRAWQQRRAESRPQDQQDYIEFDIRCPSGPATGIVSSIQPNEIQVQVEAEIDIQVERRNFAVSKSLTQSLTVGSVAFEKAGAHRVTHRADPARACHDLNF
jgi:hypothetical protein